MCSSTATSAGAPFAQRFTGRFSADDATIRGRWELAKDGETWRRDFDVIYTRVAEADGAGTERPDWLP